jgi:4a-hydroxytetrahydrobiopterin dehydratase
MNSYPKWEQIDNKLFLRLKFKDFKEAFSFLGEVAILAEEANHHPDIFNSFNVVELSLSTKDAGGIVTGKDIVLSEKISEILKKF